MDVDLKSDGEESARQLFDTGLERLRGLFGEGWTVEAAPGHQQDATDWYTDRVIEIRSTDLGHTTRYVVDLKSSLTPRTVNTELLSKLHLVRQVNSFTSLMVMAPWISPKTQDLLRAHGISYLDLTRNVWIRADRPAIFIYTEGQMRAPRSASPSSSAVTLSGSKAERLVRILADVRPPYRASDLAEATGLSLAYVSRLLGALEDQLLIRRDGRTIHTVNWQGLLRARAEHSHLLNLNPYSGFIAPNGIDYLLNQLRNAFASRHLIAITGSYAAREVAPLSVGGQLMVYIRPDHFSDELVDHLGLLEVKQQADVLFLDAHDPVVFWNSRTVGGLRHVALSQLALDCLSGPGRLPAEGEAVLERMAAHEQWRNLDIHTIKDWKAA
ncbi:helix-turn-helix domain-containing protein (plasmid) [Streptomyces castrisilvae]|uniref:Helix-turn-helix domain-containing protein n=1 Tax=Streptomyces castrisilvae TaxID=3033811 RepID=A0ABY9HYY4_9ACTN|nr:helix-turn-helix domain-containing protein [Streptomyces sp. Mut1]WLQ38581.1 helix-turn-helix domain-containing protein [Streptomyces sp. Mut1]